MSKALYPFERIVASKTGMRNPDIFGRYRPQDKDFRHRQAVAHGRDPKRLPFSAALTAEEIASLQVSAVM